VEHQHRVQLPLQLLHAALSRRPRALEPRHAALPRAFARLPGRWEVKISGGEPFVHRRSSRSSPVSPPRPPVSVVSNFSASEDKLAAFVAAAAAASPSSRRACISST